MIIKKKRIRNLEKYMRNLEKGKIFYIGFVDLEHNLEQLNRVGFSRNLEVGERVLPSSSFGSISRFNAEGKYIKRKDLPMETAYRQVEWHWKTWDGQEHSDAVDVPYKRYPRDYVSPPSIELLIVKNLKGDKIVVAEKLIYKDEYEKEILHYLNLFLEIFGECEILTEELTPSLPKTFIRLNWNLLPPGKYPWKKIREHFNHIIEKAKKGHQPLITNRLEIINKAEPDLHAVGKGGFHGYIVFGFTNKNLYVIESAYYGNATYVFEEGWEQFSKLTKAQILNNKLQKDRIVHQKGWEEAVLKLLA